MKTKTKEIFTRIYAFAVFLSLHVAVADEPNKIKRNPFERPAIASISPAGQSSSGRDVDQWNPSLRAVLVAGSRSVANLGGVILQVGESSNGYQLISVSDGTAIFRLRGERIVKSLYEQEISEGQ